MSIALNILRHRFKEKLRQPTESKTKTVIFKKFAHILQHDIMLIVLIVI